MNCQYFSRRAELQEDFINVFAYAMDKNIYVNSKWQQGEWTYSCGAKGSNCKTKEITEKAKERFAYLSSNFCLASPDKRLEAVKKLGQALNTLAGRIENSIEGKWWYPIMHLFGYQAKAPEAITTLLESIDKETRFLEAN